MKTYLTIFSLLLVTALLVIQPAYQKAYAGATVSNDPQHKNPGGSATADKTISFRLYPNPATSEISLDLISTVPAVLSMNIYDVNGKRIWMAPSPPPPSKHHFSINLADVGILQSGIYFLEVNDGANSFGQRFIVL